MRAAICERRRICTGSRRSSARCSSAESCSTIAARMALKTRVRSAGRLVLLTVALVITYLIFAATSMRLALRARDVEVPNLVNRTASEATTVAADAGLTLRVDDMRRIDPKVEPGHVLVQDPPPGSVTRRSHVIK